jgi:signal transduction histidine kinase
VSAKGLLSTVELLETQISVLVKSIEQEANEELSNAAASMRNMQDRIIFLIPTTAISTFFIAAFFGWAITRRIVELRLEERVSERTRIAHDLHDNLLQSVVSASMQLHLAVKKLPADSPAMPLLTRIAQIIEQVIDEGRETIRGYRPSDSEDQDLARAFSTVQQGLGPNGHIDFRVTVEGRPRALNPAIRNDVYSIGREALVNSFHHSGASRIEIKLEYSISEFHVLVRDDGSGIDSQVLQSGPHRALGAARDA